MIASWFLKNFVKISVTIDSRPKAELHPDLQKGSVKENGGKDSVLKNYKGSVLLHVIQLAVSAGWWLWTFRILSSHRLGDRSPLFPDNHISGMVFKSLRHDNSQSERYVSSQGIENGFITINPFWINNKGRSWGLDQVASKTNSNYFLTNNRYFLTALSFSKQELKEAR